MNHELNVCWPERPQKGRYSLVEYLKRRNQFENDSKFKRRMHKARSSKEDTESTQAPNEVAALFVGARKTSVSSNLIWSSIILTFYSLL
jgi:hypothetical protein